jgi:hypothetical protein
VRALTCSCCSAITMTSPARVSFVPSRWRKAVRADAEDLAKMRDGTKLTRAGLKNRWDGGPFYPFATHAEAERLIAWFEEPGQIASEWDKFRYQRAKQIVAESQLAAAQGEVGELRKVLGDWGLVTLKELAEYYETGDLSILTKSTMFPAALSAVSAKAVEIAKQQSAARQGQERVE